METVMEMLYNHPLLMEGNHSNNHPLPIEGDHPLPSPKEGNYDAYTPERGNCGAKNSPPSEGCQPVAGGVVDGSRVVDSFTPIDVLDYIYAVLHSPMYREKYKEFLKIDFPRVPYPENAEKFWALVKLGGKLRKLHLMEGVEPQQGVADYPEKGSNEIEKPEYKNGKVWINDTQYFDHVPPEAWEFYIGGYQPAQKWLKDRKGRKLEFEDIRHYQRIVRVLWETERLMGLSPQKNKF
jgi:predicted helicase